MIRTKRLTASSFYMKFLERHSIQGVFAGSIYCGSALTLYFPRSSKRQYTQLSPAQNQAHTFFPACSHPLKLTFESRLIPSQPKNEVPSSANGPKNIPTAENSPVRPPHTPGPSQIPQKRVIKTAKNVEELVIETRAFRRTRVQSGRSTTEPHPQ
jgi:hypothetical protein